MIDKLTSADIANNISMLRSSHKGPIVVVEGITDSRLYGKFVDRAETKIVPAHSKDNVKRAVAEVWGTRNDKKTIGIVDADTDVLRGRKYNPPIFISDKRDLESMMMSTGALDDVLTEYSDPELLENFEKNHGKVKDVIARSAYPIGLLMFISMREGLGLNFKNIDHSVFINRKTLAIDMKKMIDEIFTQSVSRKVGRKELADMISEEGIPDDPWTVVRGHDAESVLTIGLNEVFGSYNGRGTKTGQLSGALRLAFSIDYFRETEVYRKTTEWSRRNNFVLWITQR
ncbi:MAG: DUF4435 domain-containing protein [Candidatus Methanoplasma sp.]|jgi:hypothetical protein|nr:DUF4435 domain-containing protein [Candidatus Methanoplasma sp.]